MRLTFALLVFIFLLEESVQVLVLRGRDDVLSLVDGLELEGLLVPVIACHEV